MDKELYSAGMTLKRPLSTATQIFKINEDKVPVGKPMPKVESITQVSGKKCVSVLEC